MYVNSNNKNICKQLKICQALGQVKGDHKGKWDTASPLRQHTMSWTKFDHPLLTHIRALNI